MQGQGETFSITPRTKSEAGEVGSSPQPAFPPLTGLGEEALHVFKRLPRRDSQSQETTQSEPNQPRPCHPSLPQRPNQTPNLVSASSRQPLSSQ